MSSPHAADTGRQSLGGYTLVEKKQETKNERFVHPSAVPLLPAQTIQQFARTSANLPLKAMRPQRCWTEAGKACVFSRRLLLLPFPASRHSSSLFSPVSACTQEGPSQRRAGPGAQEWPLAQTLTSFLPVASASVCHLGEEQFEPFSR